MDNQQLRNAGLKVTGPRLKILKILEKQAPSMRHLSAEAIYEAAGKTIGLATIYRVLSQFEETGLVTRQNFEGGYAVFELNQGTHHDHLVCVKCKHVEEFRNPIITQQQKKITQQFKFTFINYNLIIYGICANCLNCENP
jgi:Fur family transcriptional regulator, ferric uptake regulator